MLLWMCRSCLRWRLEEEVEVGGGGGAVVVVSAPHVLAWVPTVTADGEQQSVKDDLLTGIRPSTWKENSNLLLWAFSGLFLFFDFIFLFIFFTL